eukprot:4715825-Alexandrium_andersonii.AAC.1
MMKACACMFARKLLCVRALFVPMRAPAVYVPDSCNVHRHGLREQPVVTCALARTVRARFAR